MNKKFETYTCPMHPEVAFSSPGKCPICGMALELAKGEQTYHVSEVKSSTGWRAYTPLIVVVVLTILVSVVISLSLGFTIENLVIHFMTGFFLVFSAFKFMDLKGFAEGYSTYDLLARRWFGYGYIYPFLELGFGLSMLWGHHPDWLLWVEFGLMTFSGLGVGIQMTKGKKFQCACLGTFLKVPLTKATLVEDFGMAALAIVLIVIQY